MRPCKPRSSAKAKAEAYYRGGGGGVEPFEINGEWKILAYFPKKFFFFGGFFVALDNFSPFEDVTVADENIDLCSALMAIEQ